MVEVQTKSLPTLPLTEAVRRRLLAFVLLAVLVWYTVVVPAPPAPFVRRSGGGPRDAEERDADHERAPRPPAEDLDWPEYIDG